MIIYNWSPIVSVIIPCYNQAHFLTDAVNSVKDQTYQNWECIIVNDGSTDNTHKISNELAQQDNRIRVITQKNKGLSGARNTGLLYARGNMLQFLDADDKLENEKLKMQSEFLIANKDFDIVFSDARYFTTNNPSLRDLGPYAQKENIPWIVDLWYSPGSLLEKIIHHNLFPINSPLINRKVFDRVGLWNEDLDALEDWEFWIRCVIQEIKITFHNSRDSLALIRIHSASMTQDKTRINYASYKMRKFIGPLIINNEIRYINFIKGLGDLRKVNYPSVYQDAFNLFIAHRSVKSLYHTIIFIIKVFSKQFKRYA